MTLATFIGTLTQWAKGKELPLATVAWADNSRVTAPVTKEPESVGEVP